MILPALLEGSRQSGAIWYESLRQSPYLSVMVLKEGLAPRRRDGRRASAGRTPPARSGILPIHSDALLHPEPDTLRSWPDLCPPRKITATLPSRPPCRPALGRRSPCPVAGARLLVEDWGSSPIQGQPLVANGDSGGIRTRYPLVINQLLYPNELRCHFTDARQSVQTKRTPWGCASLPRGHTEPRALTTRRLPRRPWAVPHRQAKKTLTGSLPVRVGVLTGGPCAGPPEIALSPGSAQSDGMVPPIPETG